MRHSSSEETRETPYPFYNYHPLKAAYIHISDVCNFRCPPCRFSGARSGSFVSGDRVRKKIDRARRLGFRHLILTGRETLLHPRLDDIVTWALGRRRCSIVSLVTNGLAFASEAVQRRLARLEGFRGRLMIGVSVNFYDAATFRRWSGHDRAVFQKWEKGLCRALERGFVRYLDIILKQDTPVVKVLRYLSRLTDGESEKLSLRVGDLMPFNQAQITDFLKLKHALPETRRQIEEIASFHPGPVEFEAFPTCVFDQRRLREGCYTIPGFQLVAEKGLPIQYDSLVYEAYFSGPTENWLIDTRQLAEAYRRMFVYLDGACRGCYYSRFCRGVCRSYVRRRGEEAVRREIRWLKEVNWT